MCKPQGHAIAHIRLPERCVDLCSGGPKRHPLSMASTSRCRRCSRARSAVYPPHARHNRRVPPVSPAPAPAPPTAPAGALRLFVALWPDAAALYLPPGAPIEIGTKRTGALVLRLDNGRLIPEN